MAMNPLLFETTVWLSRQKYEEAESAYQLYLSSGRPKAKPAPGSETPPKCKAKGKSDSEPGSSGLVSQIENMRNKISDVLKGDSPPTRKSPATSDVVNDRIQNLEKENEEFKQVTCELRSLVLCLEKRVVALEQCVTGSTPGGGTGTTTKGGDVQKQVEDEDDDDDDIDLFGSDDDDEEAEKLKAERIKMYEEKKKKKTAVVAKSNLILDVKPWDDETDMKEVEACVRSIEMDGLVWGASKLVPVGYGINKLQILCVIVDDKVSTDDIEEKITGFEDHIQSMDIAAFNKV